VNCFGSWLSNKLVKELDICKRASCHHSIVTSPGSVRVEFTRGKAARKLGEAVFIPYGNSCMDNVKLIQKQKKTAIIKQLTDTVSSIITPIKLM
jgi:hypothetical protein